MTAPLFVVDPGALDGLGVADVVDLTGPEAHHAATVVRLEVGEEVLVADRQGARVLTEVTEIARELVRLRVLPVPLALRRAAATAIDSSSRLGRWRSSRPNASNSSSR